MKTMKGSKAVMEKVILAVEEYCKGDPAKAKRITQCLQDTESDIYVVLNATVSALLDVVHSVAEAASR